MLSTHPALACPTLKEVPRRSTLILPFDSIICPQKLLSEIALSVPDPNQTVQFVRFKLLTHLLTPHLFSFLGLSISILILRGCSRCLRDSCPQMLQRRLPRGMSMHCHSGERIPPEHAVQHTVCDGCERCQGAILSVCAAESGCTLLAVR